MNPLPTQPQPSPIPPMLQMGLGMMSAPRGDFLQSLSGAGYGLLSAHQQQQEQEQQAYQNALRAYILQQQIAEFEYQKQRNAEADARYEAELRVGERKDQAAAVESRAAGRQAEASMMTALSELDPGALARIGGIHASPDLVRSALATAQEERASQLDIDTYERKQQIAARYERNTGASGEGGGVDIRGMADDMRRQSAVPIINARDLGADGTPNPMRVKQWKQEGYDVVLDGKVWFKVMRPEAARQAAQLYFSGITDPNGLPEGTLPAVRERLFPGWVPPVDPAAAGGAPPPDVPPPAAAPPPAPPASPPLPPQLQVLNAIGGALGGLLDRGVQGYRELGMSGAPPDARAAMGLPPAAPPPAAPPPAAPPPAAPPPAASRWGARLEQAKALALEEVLPLLPPEQQAAALAELDGLTDPTAVEVWKLTWSQLR